METRYEVFVKSEFRSQNLERGAFSDESLGVEIEDVCLPLSPISIFGNPDLRYINKN